MIGFWQGFVSGVVSTMAFEFVVSLVFIILAVKGARDRDRQ